MIGEKKAANAIGGRTVRACDSCLLKRARWFCAADDAFLCQACNTSVHSANQLASRHERVRLQTSSFKGMNDANRNSIYSSTADEDDDEYSPKWLRGFTRKARTPRHNNKAVAAVQQASKDGDIDKALNDLPFVPEMSNEEDQSPISEGNKEEDELLYQVPVFDPFAAELCKPIGDEGVRAAIKGNEDYQLGQQADEHEFDHQLQGFLQSDLELAEFSADVESLLGVAGLKEDQSCNDHDIKGLELDDLLGCKEEDDDFDIDIDIDVNFNEVCVNTTDLESRVKVEDGESVLGCDQVMNLNSSTNDHENFGSESSPAEMKKKNASLRLNYEAVIAAWASQGSPWMTGIRPEVKPDHGWLDCVDMRCTDFRHSDGHWGGLIVGSRLSDGGREARVSRYREKRRTRLFSKKIRYEVRKLNAEKRPRMKGRFVKRTSFMGINNTNNTTTNSTTTFPYHFMNK